MTATLATFKQAILDIATNFVGLVETEQNKTFDDPKTPGPDKEKSDTLKRYMRMTGWSDGQPYCAAFDGAIFVLAMERVGIALNVQRFLKLWTPHCMTNVRTFKERGKLDQEPTDCSLMLMRHGTSDRGHAAICLRVDGVFPNRNLATAEGNTMPGVSGDQRQGDGCYLRARNVRTNGDLTTQGFVSAKTVFDLVTAA